MGIGIAFATGFLKGHTDVAKEKAAEALKKQELEAEQRGKFADNFIDYMKSDDPQQNVAEFLRDKAGYSPLDLSYLGNTMNDIENTIAFGSFKLQKPEKWDEDIRDDNMLRAGGTWLRTVQGLFTNEESGAALIKELESNPTALRVFNDKFKMYSDYYVMGMRKENTNSATGVTSAYLPPSVAFGPLFEAVGNLRQPTPDNTNQITIQDNPDIENPANSVVFKFRDESGKQSLEAREFDEGVYTSLQALAINLGYKGSQNVSPVQQMVDSYDDVMFANNADEAFKTLFIAAELERAGAGAFNMTGGGSEATRANIGNLLEEKFQGDRFLMAQAMAPLMVLDEDQFNKSSRLTYSMQPAATYFKKYLNVDVAQVREQTGETQETLRLLEQLKGKLGKESTPTGFVAALKSVFGGAFGEGGQVSQLLGDNTDGVSSDEVMQRAKDMGFISTTVIKDLSEMEALKLTLAAKMARAIDPSGRLSNQDFEVQLQRLGQSGFFTSKVQAQSKLDTVIEDFTARSKRLTVLDEIANAPTFGAREARLLKANMAVQSALDARRAGSYTTSTQRGSQKEPAAVPAEPLTLDSDMGFYTDGKGNYFKDEQGQSPVSTEEFNAKFNEVYT